MASAQKAGRRSSWTNPLPMAIRARPAERLGSSFGMVGKQSAPAKSAPATMASPIIYVRSAAPVSSEVRPEGTSSGPRANMKHVPP